MPTRTETDVADLYAAHARRLQQIVRGDVRAPDPVIEDACQFAWSRLVYLSARIRRETALSWLAATAIHEAFRLIRRERRELSLEALLEEGLEQAAFVLQRSPEDIVALRQRMAELRVLPERQQRLVWLRGLGLSYAEMATHERCTERTVERQLLHARERIRAASGE